ncbi:sulfotransferase [Catenovulum agarivorans]|uniref:sulfotransferase n=1 Tax=Catenovulum agarivorans TaxID=1172192 RepID=UPI00031E9D94|nr:sulfotransferase [Catenovulum agarivorans]
MSTVSNSQNKIFVIGLPRTATTSLCVAMLELGFKTAHTAFTDEAFNQAQVIADAPVFADFAKLACIYPDSKFINLQRDLDNWFPSIQQLLLRMYKNIVRVDGGFNPHLKRVYQDIFQPFTLNNINDLDFLRECYLSHQQQVQSCFSDEPQRLLNLNIANSGSYQQLIAFLHQQQLLKADQPIAQASFQPINMAGKVTAWQQIRHANKVESTRLGKVDKLAFLTDN